MRSMAPRFRTSRADLRRQDGAWHFFCLTRILSGRLGVDGVCPSTWWDCARVLRCAAETTTAHCSAWRNRGTLTSGRPYAHAHAARTHRRAGPPPPHATPISLPTLLRGCYCTRAPHAQNITPRRGARAPCSSAGIRLDALINPNHGTLPGAAHRCAHPSYVILPWTHAVSAWRHRLRPTTRIPSLTALLWAWLDTDGVGGRGAGVTWGALYVGYTSSLSASSPW